MNENDLPFEYSLRNEWIGGVPYVDFVVDVFVGKMNIGSLTFPVFVKAKGSGCLNDLRYYDIRVYVYDGIEEILMGRLPPSFSFSETGLEEVLDNVLEKVSNAQKQWYEKLLKKIETGFNVKVSDLTKEYIVKYGNFRRKVKVYEFGFEKDGWQYNYVLKDDEIRSTLEVKNQDGVEFEIRNRSSRPLERLSIIDTIKIGMFVVENYINKRREFGIDLDEIRNDLKIIEKITEGLDDVYRIKDSVNVIMDDWRIKVMWDRLEIDGRGINIKVPGVLNETGQIANDILKFVSELEEFVKNLIFGGEV